MTTPLPSGIFHPLNFDPFVIVAGVDRQRSGEAFAESIQGIRPKLEVEVIKRSDAASGFRVLPRRWVVERTFGWLMRQRRLVRDYEATENWSDRNTISSVGKIRLGVAHQRTTNVFIVESTSP